MKWIPSLLCLVLLAGPATAADDALHREIRLIRRAFLDVLGLLPTPEEVDWYVVYNKEGYKLATDYLVQKAASPEWTLEKLRAPEYVDAPARIVERPVLERNVLYLAGQWRGELTQEAFDAGAAKFIHDALENTGENVSNAIDWMVNALTCRPSSAAEENELSAIFLKVSLKSNEAHAWRTVLLHIFELPDCKYK